MKIIFLSIIFFFINLSFGQKREVDSVIKVTVEEFLTKKIKDFIILENYCDGNFKMLEVGEIDCEIADSELFIFWKDKKSNFVKRIGDCENPITKIKESVFDFYKSNIEEIKNKEVKIHKLRKDSICGDKSYSYRSHRSHSCFSKYYFYDKSELINKKFDHYDLTSSKDVPNINYDYNKSLAIVKLNNLCEKIIKKYKLE